MGEDRQGRTSSEISVKGKSEKAFFDIIYRKKGKEICE